MIRLVVVDDHPVVIDGVRAALAESGVEVVGVAATGAEAAEQVTVLLPDVVLMDLGLPDVSGVEVIRRLRDADLEPAPAVLAFTTSDDMATVMATLRAGAAGYVLKGTDRAGLIRAIEAVAGGDALFLGPEIARVVLSAAADPALGERSGPLANLTRRELEVLDLMAAGWGNQAIAARLFLAAKTVRNHVSNVITKLGVADRGEAIVTARRLGLGRIE